MFKQSQEEKEFFEKQKGQKDNISILSDREIQENQLKLLTEINKNNQSIKNNIQFWFYLTIISLVITVLTVITKS